MLAFDLMYCSRCYSFYRDLIAPVSTRAKKKSGSAPSAAELAQKEAERLAQIEKLEQELDELESVSDGCEDISLIGVQVTSDDYGIGTVVEQEVNKVDVQFPDIKKTFILDKKYSRRPRFEDDETIVDAFTEYGRRQEKIKELKRQLDRLQK